MEWRDEAIVLSARPFGENSKIVELLSPQHGRVAGMVRGARSKAQRAALQPGNRVSATWRGRLADQLGTLALEVVDARAARLVETPWGAFALGAVVSMLAFVPEHDAQPRLFAATEALTETFALAPATAEAMLRFEIILLEEFGFGLDLTSCAATGETNDLVFVSPRTGRAVSRLAGAPYAGRLLPLPGFLANRDEPVSAAAAADGFRMTGHFLSAHVAGALNKPLPAARERFVRTVTRHLARAEQGGLAESVDTRQG